MIDNSKLKATPELEDFAGKYENSSKIATYLVDSYFKAVKKLLTKTENVLKAHEVGAGEGRSTMRLSKMVPSLSASEFVPHLVELAIKNNPTITILEESVYELNYKDESVDLVFLLEVLEHLDYPEAALEELKRISNRYLILGVPREPIWRILNMCRFKYIKHLGNTPGHLNHWSKSSLIKLIEEKYGKVLAVESPLPWTIVLAEKY
ncbi:class I SAM-dependent methyltransferase [Lacinutrix himadriensis]|uniref:class I SAM-dependent methyltransferase n=1 Tax=Lacinutrix himadriensis TaxID=641549 RepID=UPI0006E1F43B|nr:class I SAM-dependent methyltransferase [Lacinutrix himadriensis]